MFNKFKRWKQKGKMYSLRRFQCGFGFLSSFNLEAPRNPSYQAKNGKLLSVMRL
jgi:hypothetical protein